MLIEAEKKSISTKYVIIKINITKTENREKKYTHEIEWIKGSKTCERQ